MAIPSALRQPQPWRPADATDCLRHLAMQEHFALQLTSHARQQMGLRDLYTGDVLHVLKHGFVYEPAEPATQSGAFRYRIESTPPSDRRTVRIIAIPQVEPPAAKIVTVMWRDEPPQ